MLGVALWSLAYAFSLAQVTLSAQLFWINMCYLGIGLVPASWLAFALEYVGLRAWLTRRRLALLAIEPLLVLALALTNDLHQLFRTQVRLLDVGTYLVLESVLGPAFWLHTVYSYLLTVVGTFLLLRNFVRRPRVYRRQASALLVAVSPMGREHHVSKRPQPIPLSGLHALCVQHQRCRTALGSPPLPPVRDRAHRTQHGSRKYGGRRDRDRRAQPSDRYQPGRAANQKPARRCCDRPIGGGGVRRLA